MAQPFDASLPNAFVRQSFIATQEVLGVNRFNLMLEKTELQAWVNHLPPDDVHSSFKASDFSRFFQTIETNNERNGRGLLHRIGKAMFQQFLHEQQSFLDLAGKALRFLPPNERILLALQSLATAYKEIYPQRDIWVERLDQEIAFLESTCAFCSHRNNSAPICYPYAGLISEAINWATGSEYEVNESHCIAKGDAYCRFRVVLPSAG